ncbi:MAG: glycosyltransferase family 2 protein [Anaerolineaceae bacterium]
MIDSFPSCSVVIPVYNGSETLAELVDRLTRTFSNISLKYEIIMVNDGSPDESWQVIQSLAAKDPTHITGINLKRNFGQHNALLCGVRAAKNEVIITMDDDLQHPPEEITKLLEKLQSGYDVVYGLPTKMPHSAWRNFFSWFTKRSLAKVMGVKTIRDISSFRAFRASLKDAFSSFRSPSVILDVLLSWGTNRFGTVFVNEEPRQQGKSNYNFLSLASQALLILTGFSTIPLRFATLVGFFFILFGIAVFLYVLVVTLTAGSIPGFPFLASMIAIFSGVQLFSLGLIGEYLGRIFDRSMERPPYVSNETTQK